MLGWSRPVDSPLLRRFDFRRLLVIELLVVRLVQEERQDQEISHGGVTRSRPKANLLR